MTDAPKRIWINIDAPWDGLINPVHGTGGLPGYILDTPAALSEAPEVKALIAEAVENIRLAFHNVDSQVEDEGEFTERSWEQLRAAIEPPSGGFAKQNGGNDE
jgi:hypothetical protein